MFLHRELLEAIEQAIDAQKEADEGSLYYGEQAAKANREGSQAAKANVVRALEAHAKMLAKKVHSMYPSPKEDEIAHFLCEGQTPLTVLQGIQLPNCEVGSVLSKQRRLTNISVLLPSDHFELIEALIAAVRSVIFSVGDPRKSSTHPLKKVAPCEYFLAVGHVLRKATEWLIYYGIQAYELKLCLNAKILVEAIVRCAALLAETFDWLTESGAIPPRNVRSFARRLYFLLALLHVKGHSAERVAKSAAVDVLRENMPLETGQLKKCRGTYMTSRFKKNMVYPTVTRCDAAAAQFPRQLLPKYHGRLRDALLDDFVYVFNHSTSRELNSLTVAIIFEHLTDDELINLHTWIPFYAADKRQSRALTVSH